MRFDPQSNFLPEQQAPAVVRDIAGAPVKPGLQKRLVLGAVIFAIVGGVWIWKSTTVQSDSTTAAGVIGKSPGSTAERRHQTPAAEPSGPSEMTESRAPAGTAPPSVFVTPKPTQAAAGSPHAPAEVPDDPKRPGREAYESGRALLAFGRFEDAIPFLEEAVALDPEFAEAHYRLGVALIRAGNRDRAREQLRVLKPLDASLANLLANLVRSSRHARK